MILVVEGTRQCNKLAQWVSLPISFHHVGFLSPMMVTQEVPWQKDRDGEIKKPYNKVLVLQEKVFLF
jgi:hypothetical protein